MRAMLSCAEPASQPAAPERAARELGRRRIFGGGYIALRLMYRDTTTEARGRKKKDFSAASLASPRLGSFGEEKNEKKYSDDL
jgi:hypothetical protein